MKHGEYVKTGGNRLKLDFILFIVDNDVAQENQKYSTNLRGLQKDSLGQWIVTLQAC